MRLRIILAGEKLRDKILLLRYFLTKKHDRIINIKISRDSKIITRPGKDNDIWMADPKMDREFFNYVKENNFKRIIDIGANIGRYSLIFSEGKDAEVISFEPSKNNFNALNRNIQANCRENIVEKEIGIYDESKEIEISECPENEGGNSIYYDRGGEKKKIIVKKLDDMKLKPDLIKIDVEGVELNVLKGAIKTIEKYHPQIYFEVTRQSNEIINFLLHLGYDVEKFTEGNWLAVPKRKAKQ